VRTQLIRPDDVGSLYEQVLHAVLVLGELGLLRLVVPEAAVAEVRRNLTAKLPRPLRSSRRSFSP
jgi:hypothetical protein